MTNLIRLYLDNNQLEGLIPDALTNLTSLTDGSGLDIENNHLCTMDSEIKAFVDLKAGTGWENTQTNTVCANRIPTLNEWGMIVLCCLFLVGSLAMIKKNRTILS